MLGIGYQAGFRTGHQFTRGNLCREPRVETSQSKGVLQRAAVGIPSAKAERVPSETRRVDGRRPGGISVGVQDTGQIPKPAELVGTVAVLKQRLSFSRSDGLTRFRNYDHPSMVARLRPGFAPGFARHSSEAGSAELE